MRAFSVKPVDKYRAFVDNQIAESWNGPFIVSKGTIQDTRTQPGFAAVEDGEVIGYALYNIADNECEITVLESLRGKRGVGSALIDEVVQAAKDEGLNRIWLMTTNDNTRAIRFYQKYGFTLREVYINSMETARKLKPQIPAEGEDGIPIAHEFEFEIHF